MQCQRKEKERNKKRVRIRNEQNDEKEGKEKEFNGPYEKGGNPFKNGIIHHYIQNLIQVSQKTCFYELRPVDK